MGLEIRCVRTKEYEVVRTVRADVRITTGEKNKSKNKNKNNEKAKTMNLAIKIMTIK